MSEGRRFFFQILFLFILIFGFVALTHVNNLHIEELRRINVEHEMKIREMEQQQLEKQLQSTTKSTTGGNTNE